MQSDYSFPKSEQQAKFLGDLSGGRDNKLDFIRFFAATLVIYYHSFPLGQGSNNWDLVKLLTQGQWTSGSFGVAIFFIISGYLITQSYEHSRSLPVFLKYRFLRIFPGLMAALLFAVFVIGPSLTSLSVGEYFNNPDTYQYLNSVFLYPMYWHLPGVFENNIYPNTVNGSLWTISFEFLFYLFVALVGVIGLLKHKLFILLLFIVSMYHHLFFLKINPMGGHLFGLERKTLLELFIFFCAGMLFYAYRSSIPKNKHLAMLSIAILYLSTYFGGTIQLFVVFGTYLVFYFAFSKPNWLNRFSKYGDFSYGLYIYAFPIQQSVTHFFGGRMNALLNFFISFALTLLLAYISWHLIEKQFLKLKKIPILFKPGNGKLTIHEVPLLNSLLKRVTPISWPVFLAGMLVFAVGFTYYMKTPESIEFPFTRNQSIFFGNWLPQGKDENYRWIEKEAGVVLVNRSEGSTLRIEGFIPGSFVEVTELKVTINDRPAGVYPVKAGEALTVQLPVEEIGQCRINLIFNGVHQPSTEAADQRIMSALISKISLT